MLVKIIAIDNKILTLQRVSQTYAKVIQYQNKFFELWQKRKQKSCSSKKVAAKKEAPKKATAAKKVEVVINAENAGFKAGDVYQALASAEKAFSVKENVKQQKLVKKKHSCKWVGFSKKVKSRMREARLFSFNFATKIFRKDQSRSGTGLSLYV